MTQTQGAAPLLAQVAVSDATIYYDKLYTYLVPARLEGHIFVGSMVLVPFGRGKARPRVGVVVELACEEAPNARIKELWDAAPQEAGLSDELLGIVRWLRETTFCTWFEAVRAVLPRGAQYDIRRDGDAWQLQKKLERITEVVYTLAGEGTPDTGPRKLTDKQRAVLDALATGPQSRAALCEALGVTDAVPQGLVKRGLVLQGERDQKPQEDFSSAPRWAKDSESEADLTLSPAQRQVADGLLACLAEEKPKPALLYGVTGSGKTLIFLELIRQTLEAGKAALVLVPEIGLTGQMLGALQAAFGSAVAVQHSGLSATQRVLQWRAIQRGQATVVVGTRSAVFAPMARIGLVVVDEEQEHTYQSESAPRYDAIEVAKGRVARHGALLLLASATPSVTSFYMAQNGRYRLFSLKERYGNLPLPRVEMADMSAELTAGNAGVLSRPLADAIRHTIAAGDQVILLLNRRGYHRVALCRDCGEAVQCGDCSVPMVFHKAGTGPEGPTGKLVCHYCGKLEEPAPTVCPACGGALRYTGFGTQRLEDELAQLLPAARVLRMDMDTTARKGSHAALLQKFAAGGADILLGTQMVAKGLDFEKVKLVGVVGIDSLLFGQGYRAFEQVFALVTQVVGRSGRANSPGRAIIQTVDPNHPVLRLAAKQDYEAFYEEESGFRSLALYPPYCALCMVGFVAAQEEDAKGAARAFAAMLAARARRQEQKIPLRVLGPAPMQVVRQAGAWRYRLTVKCRGDAAFRALAWQVLDDYNKEGWPKKATVFLDFHADF